MAIQGLLSGLRGWISGNSQHSKSSLKVSSQDWRRGLRIEPLECRALLSVSPTVTDPNISILSTGSGTHGEYIVGDTVTVQWDNTTAGDGNAAGNAAITNVNVDFSTFGGSPMNSASESSPGIWTASCTITAGTLDQMTANAVVTAVNSDGAYSYGADSTTPTVDNSLPKVLSIAIADANPTNSDTVHFTVTFSENVTGVDTADFAVDILETMGRVSDVSGSGNTYTVTVSQITGNGRLGLDLFKNDSIIDSSGNVIASGFTGATYTIDNTAPTVAADTVSTGPTSDDSLVFILNFDEIVTGVDITDLALVTTGTATGTITAVHSNDGLSYGILVTNISGDGSIAVKLNNDGTIVDASANTLSAGITTGAYAIDNTGPTAAFSPNTATPTDATLPSSSRSPSARTSTASTSQTSRL